ncbi:MAG: hypothetical protein NZ742_09130, partial [Acidobacteria bacterium]|nr:hypothetical protein [Acidobacteriota bacterium]
WTFRVVDVHDGRVWTFRLARAFPYEILEARVDGWAWYLVDRFRGPLVEGDRPMNPRPWTLDPVEPFSPR